MDIDYKYGLVLDILSKTNDGDDLEPQELKLIEAAANHQLTPRGEIKLYEIFNRICVQ